MAATDQGPAPGLDPSMYSCNLYTLNSQQGKVCSHSERLIGRGGSMTGNTSCTGRRGHHRLTYGACSTQGRNRWLPQSTFSFGRSLRRGTASLAVTAQGQLKTETNPLLPPQYPSPVHQGMPRSAMKLASAN
eukprot:359362-Chlamydomonas_euryale.AAC.5